MKSPQVFLSTFLTAALVASLLPAEPARAQTTTTAATDPVGYATLPLLANSDTLISIPFTQPVAYAGAISSISGSKITLATSPNFAPNHFVYVAGSQPAYYAIIGPNLATVTGTVTATNGSAAITATQGLSSIVANDELIVNGSAYNVASVTSDTALVLSRAYTGPTSSGLTATYDHSLKEGSYYTITANDAGSLTVNLNGDTLSAVMAGTSVSVIPYWTLGTAFPTGAASFTETLSPKAPQTLILLPDVMTQNINLAAAASYFHYQGNWRLSGGDLTVSEDDTILPPSNYFTVRNASSSTTYTPVGGVYMNRLSIPLDTRASGQIDNEVAVARPAGVALNDTGLISSGAFTSSSSPKNPADLLFTYDNTASGINKSALAIYFYYNGGWRQAGADSTLDFGTTVVPYGSAITIRKAATSTGLTSFWQNTRNY